MDYKQIQELIKLVNKSEIGEVNIESGDFKLHIRTSSYTKGKTSFVSAAPMVQAASVPVMQPSVSAALNQSVKAEEKSETTVKTESKENSSPAKAEKQIKSPMVGTFYRSPGPDKPVFVKVGDKVSKGQVVCIIEAMKLFNEIESDVEGTVIKVLTDDATPVEFDQPLFLVE